MLQHTAAYLLTIRSVLRDLKEKFNSIHQLSSVELSNFLTEKTSKLSVIDQQTAAAEKISEKIAEKEHEWALSGSLVENAIFVIWRHLDYYFHSSARPRIGKIFYTKYFFIISFNFPDAKWNGFLSAAICQSLFHKLDGQMNVFNFS